MNSRLLPAISHSYNVMDDNGPLIDDLSMNDCKLYMLHDQVVNILTMLPCVS